MKINPASATTAAISHSSTTSGNSQEQGNIGVVVLSDALDIQEKLMADLLKSLRIGQNVNIEV